MAAIVEGPTPKYECLLFGMYRAFINLKSCLFKLFVLIVLYTPVKAVHYLRLQIWMIHCILLVLASILLAVKIFKV